MKVFFDTTIRRTPVDEKHYKEIYSAIESLGHKHIFTDIMMGKRLTLDEKNESAKDEFTRMYKDRMKLLQDSDINIFEASIPSLSIGFLIEKSLDLHKPTIVFHSKDNTPILITGIQHDKLITKAYTETNMKDVVREAIGEAQEIRDKRFNFFISPPLLEYLDKASGELGITKSTFIRNLILKHMKRSAS
jgi:hypothetical protein